MEEIIAAVFCFLYVPFALLSVGVITLYAFGTLCEKALEHRNSKKGGCYGKISHHQ